MLTKSLTGQQLENYESHCSMNLNAVTHKNVPQPFSPSADEQVSSHVNMPDNCIQQIKFTASELQETLYPESIEASFSY